VSTFTPIAIVGRACTLPGALTPAELWETVAAGRDTVSSVPPDRWGVDDAMCEPDTPEIDRTWSDRGGYVRGFEFEPDGYQVAADDLVGLDPVFQWTLQTARNALADVTSKNAVVGAVLGNLSFPSALMAQYARSVWTDTERPDARNRFSSGLPAVLLEQALGLGAGAFALDAACASSLYAVKYACDRLMDGDADLMLAGAVNATDDLFIHVGFSALAALSKTGQSRPFNAEADGLVPGEGSAFVALKRLSDAKKDGDTIHGVIRGVGLSNDGRGRGFLVPTSEGQVRAIRSAYIQSGVDPASVSLLECHATGTVIGDATELTSIDEVFASEVPIGSLKSNLGHLITVAGVAGLIKVTESMASGVRPPSLHVENLSESAVASPTRILAASEAWDAEGTRTAGVSAFGFGGNNAHLVIEQFNVDQTYPTAEPLAHEEIAIVGIGVVAAGCPDRDSFAEALHSGASFVSEGQAKIESFDVDITKVGMPPKDLERTLPQQLVMLDAGTQAASEVNDLTRERTGVFVGMGVDAEVARYGARWRTEEASSREAFTQALDSPGVIGTMPNIVANRLNRALDLAGPSCTVSKEEASGLEALAIAVRGLRSHELDAAVVGAVDLSCEPVHMTAAQTVLGPDRQIPGDAAVALVVKRLTDAVADGDHVYATLSPAGDAANAQLWGPGTGFGDLIPRFGHAHCASGLFHLVGAALSVDAKWTAEGTPWLGKRQAAVTDGSRSWVLTDYGDPSSHDAVEAFHVFDGQDATAVADALAEGRRSENWRTKPQSAARLVIVAQDAATLATRTERARKYLLRGAPAGEGVVFRATPVVGKTAFVFASAGTAYEGMGNDLLRQMPHLGDAVEARHSDLVSALGWSINGTKPSNTQMLWGSSAVSRMHVELTMKVLGILPDAAIGYSSGESTSLFSLGVWNDLGAMRSEIESSGMYETALDGSFDCVAKAWDETEPIHWSVWNVMVDIDEVRSAIAEEPRLHLAIIHTATNCVIAGDAEAAQRAISQLGPNRCHELNYNMAAHVPEVDLFRTEWLSIHTREVTPVPDVAFYSAGLGKVYEPAPEACAEAILAQAVDTLDFPRVIEQAWDDGVRVFIEHGPQGLCSTWIREILGDREHEVVALDRKGRGVAQVLDAVAGLIAAGVVIDPSQLEQLVSPAPMKVHPKTAVELPAHLPPISLPRAPFPVPAPAASDPVGLSPKANGHIGNAAQEMAPSPVLPSALAAMLASVPFTTSAPAPALRPMIEPIVDTAVVAIEPAHADLAIADVSPASGVADQLELISSVHQQFLKQQAAVHARFLAGRLGSAASTVEAIVPAVAPTSPVPQPADVPVPVVPVAKDPVAQVLTQALQVLVAPPEPKTVQSVMSPSSPPPVEVPPDTKPKRPAMEPTGLSLDRQGIEVHASGVISEIFGPTFTPQDVYERQVRMPEPPLLLVDRVTGIDAEPGVHGRGVIWTETDITDESWFLNRGRMPAGILIESGQADLMLISYMGADLLNQSDRVYRLLGCELTFQDDLPTPGDTLSYEIHIDGHATQNDIRLFFFHYDCAVDGVDRIEVRHGQAGFFTDAELADSGGVIWSAETADPTANPRLDPPDVVGTRTSFDAAAVQAFADGRIWDCFGEEFALAKTHTRSPAIQSGDMLLLESVSELSLNGGPWGRGYLRGETPVTPDDWFFAGHFKNDPCMPGTLMFEGCLQALSFTMASMGFTVSRDGWRFQPAKNEPIDMVCRGQVTPTSKSVVYEVFVEEVIAGPVPTIYADLLCTVDGQKAFHAKRVGLELVPDWPLGGLPAVASDAKPVATVGTEEGPFRFDYASLLACAWGKPSDAFGPMYKRFDGPGRVPRLPGPPYHFLSRVTKVTGEMGAMEVGSMVEVEYDIPSDAWYFQENGAPTMPFAVLLEAALQPCGWLASYIGSVLTVDSELAFRNLDGAGNFHGEISAGTLMTKVELTGVSQSAGMIIVNFYAECSVDGELVYDLTTVFGFFPPEALVVQVGLPVTDEMRAELEAPSDFRVDLSAQPAPYFGGELSLGRERLLMLHRVTEFLPDGGEAGLGRVRAERDIDADDWYFKAHFFQDPVQPGSLGFEALVQLLQFYMIKSGVANHIPNARFQPVATGYPTRWKYRGQVIPTNELVQVTMDIVEVMTDEDGVVAVASGSVWCDGIRIYSTDALAMRVVDGGAPANPSGIAEITLDPELDTWLSDHRPTWQRPSLPMMSVADMLASAVPGQVVSIRDLAVNTWIDFTGPRSFSTEIELMTEGTFRVRLLSEGSEVASARVAIGSYAESPEPLTPVSGSEIPNPYESGSLFHGPAFQLQSSGVLGDSGASTVLDVSLSYVPLGVLHPALLDAALHGIPHDALHQWTPEIGADKVAYPVRITELELYGPTPTAGVVRCEVRFDGFLATPDLPRFRVQLISDEKVWAEFTVVEGCLPKGKIGSAALAERRAFLAEHAFVDGLGISTFRDVETSLELDDVAEIDWMPGTLDGIYGTSLPADIVVKEHLAQRHRRHPLWLPDSLPLAQPVTVSAKGTSLLARSAPGRLDTARVKAFWADRLGVSNWLGEDLIEGLLNVFVRDVVSTDLASFDRSAIFVANHQVQLESILVTNLLSVLLGHDVVTMANSKHTERWVGWLVNLLGSCPGANPTDPIAYFDQQDQGSMAAILDKLRDGLAAGDQSFFVHSQGTRSQVAPDPVTKISSVFLDLALECDVPIVPVRFAGGLGVAPIEGKRELPLGGQEYVVGSPISASDLSALPYAARRDHVLTALNAVPADDRVVPTDSAFDEAVSSWATTTGMLPVEATLLMVLRTVESPSEETQRVLAGADSGELVLGDDEDWLCRVAEGLYGPDGPTIRRG